MIRTTGENVIIRSTRLLLGMSAFFFLWALVGLVYLTQDGSLVPYPLMEVTSIGKFIVFTLACLSLLFLFIKHRDIGFSIRLFIVSAFFILCGIGASLFTDEVRLLDVAQLDGNVYRLTYHVDFENKSSYSLYKCDALGIMCQSTRIGYGWSGPYQLFVNASEHQISVRPSNNGQGSILYQLNSLEE